MTFNMKPKFLIKEELLAVLADMITRIEADDSFEGFIEYLIPEEENHVNGFNVRASYRIGNLLGQGGMRMVHGGFDG